MKAYFDKLHKSENETDEEKKRRYILYIIIIIIIILLLITSCSCTSKFFGKIGDLLNGRSVDITDGTGELEVIRNQELKFDSNNLEMSLSDERMKLSFSYKNINPTSFSCSTSNADIATCYVSNDYVVIIPKKVGNIVVTLQTTTNGKKYEATANVTITDEVRKIDLSSTSGTINLAISKNKNVPYTLVGLKGDITVTSSDEDIATAIAKDGVLQLTAKKTGVVTITLSLTYNDVTYTEKYTLEVINQKGTGSGSSTSPGGNTKPNPNPGGSTGTETPGNPSNPDTPGQKEPVYDVTISKIYDGESPYYLEDYSSSNPYYLKYEVLKDGELADENTLKNVSLEVNGNAKAETVKINGEYFIKVTPNSNVKSGDTAIITISSNGKTAETKVDFKIHDYNLKIDPTIYNLNYKDGSGEDVFMINTGNLFTGNLDIINTSNKVIKICSNDKKTCVNVEVQDEYKDYISIQYADTSNIATGSLPIKVMVTDKGLNGESLTNYIKVTAESYGEALKINNKESESVQINLVKNYTLIIYPNNDLQKIDGYFKGITINEGKNIGVALSLAYGEKVYLADYEAYGIFPDDDCFYYEIIEYNTQKDGKGTSYSLDYVIENLTSNLTLYPIFKDTPSNTDGNQGVRTLYLTDVNIFRYFFDKNYDKNNKTYEGYFEDEDGPHEGSSIFPGVYGTYKITLNNKSSKAITITGMNLTENTICIEELKCLNIGYKVRYDVPNSNDYIYYYGSSDKYTILNRDRVNDEYNYLSMRFGDNDNRYTFMKLKKFKEDEFLTIPSGSTAYIMLYWKWVEGEDISNDKEIIREYDKIDTDIGTYVANTNDNKYTLTVGFKFADNICVLPTDIEE